METEPQVLTSTIEPEDQARADFYALLSRLYGAAPDATLLAAIAGADELPAGPESGAGHDLAEAWHALIAASAAIVPEAATDEYQELFIGVGQSEVGLHGSTYAKGASGKPLLVDIREALGPLGLARQPGATMLEDHLAAVCETMRVLITGAGDAGVFTLSQQRRFFDNSIAPWVFVCCNAIKAKTVANYYRRVAQFTHCFMALERDSFAID
jgi:TorA maturation chaperone TorD